MRRAVSQGLTLHIEAQDTKSLPYKRNKVYRPLPALFCSLSIYLCLFLLSFFFFFIIDCIPAKADSPLRVWCISASLDVPINVTSWRDSAIGRSDKRTAFVRKPLWLSDLQSHIWAAEPRRGAGASIGPRRLRSDPQTLTARALLFKPKWTRRVTPQ